MKKWLLAGLVALGTAQAMQSPPPRPDGPVPTVSPSPLPPPPVFEIPEDTRLFTNDPEAGGVTISPADGKIAPDASFSVTFPTDIVTPDKIDAEGAESPVVAWPPLDASFFWRSPTVGDWMVTGPRIPSQTYRLRLREGRADLRGRPSGKRPGRHQHLRSTRGLHLRSTGTRDAGPDRCDPGRPDPR